MGFKRPQAFSSPHYAGGCRPPNRSYGAASAGKRMSKLEGWFGNPYIRHFVRFATKRVEWTPEKES